MKGPAMRVMRSSACLPLLSWGLRCYSHQDNFVNFSSAARHCHHCVAAFPTWPCCHPTRRYGQAFRDRHGIVSSLSASAKFRDGPFFGDAPCDRHDLKAIFPLSQRTQRTSWLTAPEATSRSRSLMTREQRMSWLFSFHRLA
jgi:hypothetical protein